METAMAIEVKKPEQLVPRPYMDVLISAIAAEGDLDKLDRLMTLRREYEADEARKAYVAAKAAFKAEPLVITKDKKNTQYGSMYTTLGNLVHTVTPYLSKHGLDFDWNVDQSNGIKVTCILRHSQGHSESVSMIVPPDKSGSKNPIQEIKSAITYAKGCTFESVCGLASTDANLDDDGNGAGMTNGELGERLEWIANCRSIEELNRIFSAAYNEAKEQKADKARLILIDARDKRKKELQ